MRIQPKKIEAPKKDPFKNDKLDRDKSAAVLTSRIQDIEGPCVLSVDAPWGAGKTTFLRMWGQHLLDEGFPVVEFNAWENDFAEIPFVALSSELTDNIKKEYGEALPKDMEQKIARFSEVSKKILKQVVPGTIQMLTKGVINMEKAMTSYAQKRLDEYSEQRDAIKEFREILKDIAETFSKSEQYKGFPLVVMIDELDRCRPTYAVEFLETAKHLFAVDNIVFVLAVNREQMAHSVQALYGNGFDAQKYLHRFFDLDFTLPTPSLSLFMEKIFSSTPIKNDFMTLPVNGALRKTKIKDLLQKFFEASDLTARDIIQSFLRMQMVFTSYGNHDSYIHGALAAFLLRTIDPHTYYKFIAGEISDFDVVKAVFEEPESEAWTALQKEQAGLWFEAAIIAAAQEIVKEAKTDQNNTHLKLEQHYKGISEKAQLDTPEKATHARAVLKYGEMMVFSDGIGFLQATKRLELLLAASS